MEGSGCHRPVGKRKSTRGVHFDLYTGPGVLRLSSYTGGSTETEIEVDSMCRTSLPEITYLITPVPDGRHSPPSLVLQ